MRFLVLTVVFVGIIAAFTSGSNAEQHFRAKRGIASFFRRIWPIRKHKNQNTETMMESASVPVEAIQYPYTDYASYQQMFNQQLYQNPEFANQFQQAAQQQLQNAQYNYQDTYQNQQQQQQQHQQQAQYQPQDQQTMSSQSNHQQAQQSPDAQDNIGPDQSASQGNYMEESAPHPSFYARPAYHDDRNQFHGRPYGSSPGTIDVHQVLDQFIRQSGLSPQGDHDNNVAASEIKPVFSMKKLYSYPFYLSSSGNKPSAHSAFGRR